MKKIVLVILLLLLSGCKTNSSLYKTTFVGSGVNDSHIIEAKALIIENGVAELR